MIENNRDNFERMICSENWNHFNNNQNSKCLENRIFSTSFYSENAEFSNNNQLNITKFSYQFLPLYFFEFDKSELFDHVSYVDVKLIHLHLKLKTEVEEIRKWKQETSLNEIKQFKTKTKFENQLFSGVSKEMVQFRSQYNSHFDESNNTSISDNAIKENVRLKKQQIELKNQMTYLLKCISISKSEWNLQSKIINEFHSEHKKVAKITDSLKVLIDENKTIFEETIEQLNYRNESLLETMDHVKFLEKKLNLRESQYHNLRNQLQIMDSDFKHLQISSRNMQKDLLHRNKKLVEKNVQLTKQSNLVKNENIKFLNQIKLHELESRTSDKSNEELKTKLDKLLLEHKDCKFSKLSLENLVKTLNQTLLNDSKLIEYKEKVINNINEEALHLKEEKSTLVTQLLELEKKFNEYSIKSVKEHNNLENKYIQESIELQRKIDNLIVQSETNSELSDILFKKNLEIQNLEKYITELKQEKQEIIEYLYKLPTSSLKWNNFY